MTTNTSTCTGYPEFTTTNFTNDDCGNVATDIGMTEENRLKRSEKLWEKLVKELDVLQDNNYTARQLFDYIERHYC
jgi:hypothetical protein